MALGTGQLEWVAEVEYGKIRFGHVINRTGHFHDPEPLRIPAEIRADLALVQAEADGLLDEIVTGGTL